MQLCCTLSETVCFEPIPPCITNVRFCSKSSSQSASQVEKASGFHVSLVIFTAVRRSLQILKPRSSYWNNASMRCRKQQQVLLQQLIPELRTLQSSTEDATQAAVSELRRVQHELSQCYALLNEIVQVSGQQPSNNFQFPQPQPQLQPHPRSSSNQPPYAPTSSSPHPPQQPPPQPPVFYPHPAHQFAVQRAPTQEILGRRVERLNKLGKKFSGKPGSGEFRTWKEDFLQPFILSDITSPVDQVTTIWFLLEGDAAEYYHSLTKAVRDDWFELMRVLGQRLDCISHEPVYLSRMLSLKESEFPRHADYVREFRTCVIKSKVNTSDLQMGYLFNSQFVEGFSNDAARRQYIVEVRSRWRSSRPFGFDTLV